jgi:hypothetical protein
LRSSSVPKIVLLVGPEIATSGLPSQTLFWALSSGVWQVRQPIYRNASGRWRNYATQLAPLRKYLGELADAT